MNGGDALPRLDNEAAQAQEAEGREEDQIGDDFPVHGVLHWASRERSPKRGCSAFTIWLAIFDSYIYNSATTWSQSKFANDSENRYT